MQSWRERRLTDGPRVPLEDVLVRVAPRDLDGDFEADAVDVGLGGLAITAPLLPHVGSEMRCTFAAPDDGGFVSARCEVVWAHDSGPHNGKFGLRFRSIEGGSEEAIRRIVERWRDALDELELDRRERDEEPEADAHATRPGDVALQPDNEVDLVQPAAVPRQNVVAPEAASRRSVQVRLEGLSSPIEGEAVRAAAGELVVEQALPFLSLGKGASDGAQDGRLADVSLRVEHGVPRLVLKLAFDAAGPSGELERPPAAPIVRDELPIGGDAAEPSRRAEARSRLPAGVDAEDTIREMTPVDEDESFDDEADRSAEQTSVLETAGGDPEAGLAKTNPREADHRALSGRLRMPVEADVTWVDGEPPCLDDEELDERDRLEPSVVAEGARVREALEPRAERAPASSPQAASGSFDAAWEAEAADDRGASSATDPGLERGDDHDPEASPDRDDGHEVKPSRGARPLGERISSVRFAMGERLRSARSKLPERVPVEGLRTALAGTLSGLLRLVRSAWAAFVPPLIALSRRFVRVAQAFGAALRGRRKTTRARRRKTARPKEVALRRQGGSSAKRSTAESSSTPMRKTLARSAVAFVAVAIAVYALVPSEGVESTASTEATAAVDVSTPEDTTGTIAEQPAMAAPTSLAPTALAPTTLAAAPQAPQAPASELAAHGAMPAATAPLEAAPPPLPRVAPPTPRALPEPVYDSGRMPAPTFPSLDRSRPATATGVQSPYARDVTAPPEPATDRPEPAAAPAAAPAAPARTLQFGSEQVRKGQTFTLRMSQPVAELRGEALANGFRVIAKGTLSLDPARIIANNHVKVERSMILNRGDHAELIVRFVEGKEPTYQVRAVGNALQITIGR